MRVNWTFENEAKWILWLLLIPPAAAILWAVVFPWLQELVSF